MWRAILLALLLCAPAEAVTRLHFGTAADSYIAFTADSGWEDASEIFRSGMHIVAEGSVTSRGRYAGGTRGSAGVINLTASSSNQDIDMQWQIRLNPGTTFTSGVTTVKMYARMAEAGTTHDVNQCIIGIRVINEDTTVQATLLSVANYGTTGEFTATTTSTMRNQTCANGDTVQATYSAVEGDYLVLEMGYQNDGATGATSQALSYTTDGAGWPGQVLSTGAAASSGDCPENDTDTTNCTAWIEFSNTFTRDVDAGPVTRFYARVSASADVTPAAVDSFWSESNSVTYRKTTKTKGTDSATGSSISMTCADFCREVHRVYVSEPMAAGNVFTEGQTTISATAISQSAGATNDLLGGALAVRIISEDGTTVRANLLKAALNGGLELSSSANRTTLASYIPVVESYTTVTGDRFTWEIGLEVQAAAAGTPTGNFVYVEGHASGDCPLGSFSGLNCDPWIEFSNNIVMASEVGRNPIVIH